MQSIHDVLRLKEQQMETLQKEIDALRLAIKIMDNAGVDSGPKPVASAASASQSDARPTGTVKHFP
ncbi:MAG TPA: hypothetical protein VN577_04250 [Terriglobales bacterium]|nr:hypothetical protein [Terriglobales bacterium]